MVSRVGADHRHALSQSSSSLVGSLAGSWQILVIAMFVIVYWRSLSFVYVEGDDAASIAYHVLGRERNIQPPYSPYQGMMDLALRLLPANEQVLRVTSILVTSVAAVVMTGLISYLVFDWISAPVRDRWIISLFLLLGSPELFFLGLYYSPSVIAMCFVLLAHVLARKLFRQDAVGNKAPSQQLCLWTVSVVAFSLGAACRWDIIIYGAVIVADLALIDHRLAKSNRAPNAKQLILAVTWGAGALLLSLVAIWASGYGFEEMARAVRGSANYVSDPGALSTSGSWFPILTFRAALLVSLVTPLFGLLTIVGFTELVRQRDPLVVVVLVGILGVLPWVLRLRAEAVRSCRAH
jgi:hypothetical protein